MPKFPYEHFFPFSSIRHEQKRAIEFALDSFESGKKFVILELGTGVGKSATAVTISRYMETYGAPVLDSEGMPLSGSYILTTQKVLQQQYVSDFGPGVGRGKNLLLSIKSSKNYTCSYYSDQTCSESRQILSQLGKKVTGTEFHKHCRGGKCPYALDKQSFIESPISVTNFSYFFAETLHGKKLTPRNLLVIDECHNTESELGKFVEMTVSEKFAKEILKCKFPSSLESQGEIFTWLSGTYRPALKKRLKALEKDIAAKLEEGSILLAEASKQYDLMDKHASKLDMFFDSYSPDNWVVNIIEPRAESKRAMRKFEFKAVDVSRFGDPYLFKFGGYVLLLSATIVDPNIFCSSVGIDPHQISYMKIPSPFPAKNRPVHFIPVGSMSKGQIDESLPRLSEAVRMILDSHPEEKGIIHAVNFKIAQYLVETIRSDRLLIHGSDDRERVLNEHLRAESPTVLISPSMMEGVDLSDDHSRFQVLCKVPYPFLGDHVIRRRLETNRGWYPYQTIKSIIQSMGRSIRNESDYATSYILDSDWEKFLGMNRGMFPSEFLESIC
jgi:ATP-dependent DNA helicase DinG